MTLRSLGALGAIVVLSSGVVFPQAPQVPGPRGEIEVNPLLRELLTASRTGGGLIGTPASTYAWSAAQLPQPARASSTSRIQLDTYTNPEKNIFNDPLTEIVKIAGTNGWGTGTFLENCRVYTALHVLLSIKHGKRTMILASSEESLVGDKFSFSTQPVPDLGKSLTGSFVVLAHGVLKVEGTELSSFQDWAIGYDEACMSVKYKLGYVDIQPGQSFLSLFGETFFTAGHSAIEAAKIVGQNHLYVDSKCGVTDKVKRNREQNGFLVTNCSMGGGGSGQLLLSTKMENGELVRGIHGRAQKFGYGIFQYPATNYGEEIPNVSRPFGLATFTALFYMKNIAPFMKARSSEGWFAEVASRLKASRFGTLSHDIRWNVVDLTSRTVRMQYTAIALHDATLRESRSFRFDLNALSTNVLRSRSTGDATDITISCERSSPAAAPPNCIQEMSGDRVVWAMPTWSFLVREGSADTIKNLLINAISSAKSLPRDERH